MNKALLRAAMVENGDTQESLASAMGISCSRLNAKVNERDGAAFNLRELSFMKERYKLSDEKATAIFFAKKVS